ncbi:XdhC family protein [Nocardia cyriacigeorgica]|uniref:XdhC family protein n=3 Tax=Nocardia cyriacigeorgica TaxID=135487 RepID=UPI0002FFA4BF|nr:XdhC/CoxI family protein [Nocardia cyriacigeorgica]AVH25164.1 xanthine dehydrogenase [Nocardia cyriacigeorgica]MBF6321429.1 XdhC family protein [Nocardia cyriacigeorgica]MBF6394677.1 XdhC family protein [Nocardia cyriacigeorgica]MBF6400311.1 XdhC family protein [Nocardia cyriacigeorgica]MBF6494894.1 XdhC family protein [Nocardia cyriacigeorgica]
MRDIVDDLLRVWHSGRTGGLATIVRTNGATDLPVGAAMLVDPDGGVFGSITAGGIEEAAYEATATSARTGQRGMHRLTVTNSLDPGRDDGVIDVFTEPFSRDHFPEFPTVAAEIAAHRRVTVFTVVWNPEPEVIGQHLITDKRHNTELVSLPQSDIFVSSFAPPPRLIIFGANSFAAALSTQGQLLGYRITICDTRPNFATPESFPGAEVVVDWPHRYLNTLSAAGEIDADTGIIVVAQDPKFEIPLLTVALRLPEVGYLAALGSPSVHARRMDDLRAGGFDDSLLARLHSPAGLSIGARTPAETAVAIAAELLAARTSRAAGRAGERRQSVGTLAQRAI